MNPQPRPLPDGLPDLTLPGPPATPSDRVSGNVLSCPVRKSCCPARAPQTSGAEAHNRRGRSAGRSAKMRTEAPTTTITLPPDLEVRLGDEARRRGTTPELLANSSPRPQP